MRRELRETQQYPDREVQQLRLKLAAAQRDLALAKQVKDSVALAQAQALSTELTKLRVSVQQSTAAFKRQTGLAQVEALGAELAAIQQELGQIQGTLSLSRLQLALILLGLCWSAIALADLVFFSRQLWQRVQTVPGLNLLVGKEEAASAGAVDFVPMTATPLSKGDEVAGYVVTSGFGARVPPCAGCSGYHPGVDLATPTGTPVFTPVAASVQCLGGPRDPAGHYARIQPHSQAHSQAPEFLLLHLDGCTPGKFQPGDRVGTTGATGQGTGPHLDVRQIEDGDYVVPTKEWVEVILTGRVATATALTDAEIRCAIGAAEGTLDNDCQPNHNYLQHIDPGNGAVNQGAFSYQHGASSPEEADARQLAHLRAQIPHYQAQATAQFGVPLSKAALLAVLDLHNQAPAAAADFIAHLPTHDPTPAQIIEARSQSFVDPATGQLDAPGLGNHRQRVWQDQQRRVEELLPHL